MKTTDFSATITSSKLKENMNKMFGLNVNLDKYDREQLEDMRNKLRTRVFQQEGRAGINDLLTNETYQKDKAMLDLLNTRIKEMLGEDIKKLRDRMVELSEGKKGVKAPKYKIHSTGTAAKDYDGDGKVEKPKDEVWGSRAKAAAKAGKPFEESAKPDANKNNIPDYAEDGKGKNDLKKKDAKVKEGFPTVADAKARAEKEKTTGKFDKKETGTGTQYTRKASTFTDGGDDTDVKAAKKKAKKTEEGFPTVADAKARSDKEKTTGKFDKKETSTGTQYTRKSNTFSDGGDDADTKKAKKAAKLKESHSIYKRHVAIVNESLAALLAEDEEGKAKAITAAGDMVNDYTSWMQRVGQYQTKTMIELADAIKADFGAQEAEAFKAAVGPALSATLEVLTQQREAVSNAVAVLAGEATPDAAMGMEPSMDMPPEPSMDIAAPDDMNAPAGDEFGASDAAAGMGTTGREMRESRFARKLAESHSIMSKLSR
jgi:hypothetical protein